ncbi:hypothetical protein M422DRAFT_269610 [Sphaerobolus stellatus SS14]|uniref:Uncharacterized protein n=1 Tax=Sphaerobolus stellatus (strain SS14) TaxID=990650 RepID=A0A0C9THV5_SPHS4|nr:hypothetical protein M422DRAFT_269610 [Sphaerobolus stellatus SS14]
MERSLDSKLATWMTVGNTILSTPAISSIQRIGNHNPSTSASLSSLPSPQFTSPVQTITDAHSDHESLPFTLTIPTIKHSKDAWKKVIEDWEKGDPACGLNKPLRDWSVAWIKHSCKAQLYAKCKIIAEEYINRYLLLNSLTLPPLITQPKLAP